MLETEKTIRGWQPKIKWISIIIAKIQTKIDSMLINRHIDNFCDHFFDARAVMSCSVSCCGVRKNISFQCEKYSVPELRYDQFLISQLQFEPFPFSEFDESCDVSTRLTFLLI